MYEDETIKACPACDAENAPLDSLGLMLWYCCRDCGMWYSQEITEEREIKNEE